MSLCATITLISLALRLTSSQITEYNLFVVSDDLVKLTANNISKDSATLQWNLSGEKKSKLKALRNSRQTETVEVSSYKELASDEDNCPFFYDDDMGGMELAWDPRVLHKLAPLHGKTSPIYTNKSINTRNTSSANVHMKMSRQRNID